MKALRSALLCAALAGAVSAAAAEPLATLRVRSAGDLLAAIRDVTALAGQPFAGAMAESQFRSTLAAAGIELRDDEPVLFAMRPKPLPAPGAAAASMLFDPPPFALSVPMAPLPAERLAMFGATNAPAEGEWVGGGDEPSYTYRDGRAFVAFGEAGRALADVLAASAPRRADALFEIVLDEPLAFQEKMQALQDGVTPDSVFADAAAEFAEKLGVPGLAPRIKELFDVTQKDARDIESGAVDLWFDATNGFAFAASATAREGSGLAARLAAAPALDPAALPAVPSAAPVWYVFSGANVGCDVDNESVLKAVRALFEGPAPSGDAAATARREAAVRAIDASLAALPALRGAAAWLGADDAGRPALVVEQLLADPAPARAEIESWAALLEAFPALASNGVALVRNAPGDVRVDVDVEESIVAGARLAHEYGLDEDDDDELWFDDEDEDEDNDEDEDDDDSDDEDDAEEEVAAVPEVANVPETDDDEDSFDEESVRADAREIAEAIGRKIEVRDAVAADGSRGRVVVCAEGAAIPEAKGLPDLAPVLALGALAADGVRPVSAGSWSLRAFVAMFLQRAADFQEKLDDPIDPEDLAKARAFAAGETDFRLRGLKAVGGRTVFSVCAIPREDIVAAAKFFVDAAGASEPSGEDATFDD